jgi:hypothetical protein
MLRRAHEFLAMGDFSAAAAAFEQLARGAEARGMPRAANLYLQAGRARVLAGENQLGVGHLKRGLSMLAANRQWTLAQQAGSRAAAELRERGLTREADDLSAHLEALLGGTQRTSSLPAAPEPIRRPLLPTQCPGCGGPVRPDEVEWLDGATAECAWCGSPLRGDDGLPKS